MWFAMVVSFAHTFPSLHIQLLSKKMVDTAKESIGKSATSLEIYGKMQEVFVKMDSEQNVRFYYFT